MANVRSLKNELFNFLPCDVDVDDDDDDDEDDVVILLHYFYSWMYIIIIIIINNKDELYQTAKSIATWTSHSYMYFFSQ